MTCYKLCYYGNQSKQNSNKTEYDKMIVQVWLCVYLGLCTLGWIRLGQITNVFCSFNVFFTVFLCHRTGFYHGWRIASTGPSINVTKLYVSAKQITELDLKLIFFSFVYNLLNFLSVCMYIDVHTMNITLLGTNTSSFYRNTQVFDIYNHTDLVPIFYKICKLVTYMLLLSR